MTIPEATAVGELLTLQRGNTYSGKLVGEPGVALLGLGSIEPGGGFREDKYKTFGGDCPDKIAAKPGDLYVALKGATKDGSMVGSVARVPLSVERGRLTQDTARLDFFNPDAELRRHVYWVLRTPQYRQYCAARVIGSASASFSREDLLSYPIPLITEKAKTLAALFDDAEKKIELNRRMNRTLEAIAQTIFKSWFVDFDPVRAKVTAKAAGADSAAIERAAMAAIAGRSIEEAIAEYAYFDDLTPSNRESLAQTAALFPDAFQDTELGEIPDGWKAGSIDSLCTLNAKSWSAKNHPNFINYVDLANTTNGEIKKTQRFNWGDSPSRARRVLKGGDTIVGTVRPGNRAFALAPMSGDLLTASTGFAVLSPKQPVLREFSYIVLTSDTNIERLARLADGGAYPAVKPDIVANLPFAMPTEATFKSFSGLSKPMFDLIEENSRQSTTLANLRDTLLPKLLSGEITVPEADSQIEAVND